MKLKNSHIDKDGYQLIDIQSVTIPLVVPTVESTLRDFKFVKAVYRNVNTNEVYCIYFLNLRSSILNRLKFKRLASNKSFIEVLALLDSYQLGKQPTETITHLSKQQIEELLELYPDKKEAEKVSRLIKSKKLTANKYHEPLVKNKI